MRSGFTRLFLMICAAGLLGCSSSEVAPSASTSADAGVDGPAIDADGGGADAQPTAAVPSAPTNVVATAPIARGAVITWTAPSSDGGSALVSYTVTASPGGKTVTTDAGKTSATMEGLDAGTSYTFTVHATNAVGNGPPSSASLPVTPAQGLSPTVLGACGGTGKVTLSASSVAGATSYNVYYGTAPGVTRANGTKITNVTFPAVLTTGLANGTPYYFVFTATDSAQIESVVSNEVTAKAMVGLHDVAFAASYSDAKITITDCFAEVADQGVAVTRTITGADTQIAPDPYNGVFADDKNKRLYVLTGTPAVLEWDNADTVDGNVAPTRVISGASTGLSAPWGIWVDRLKDRLYVANRGGAILMWANASTVSGDVAPTATLSGANTTFGTAVSQLFVDEATDRLYVGNYGNVLVFNDVSAMTGAQNVAPARSINTSSSWLNLGLSVDTKLDLLYVGSRETGGAVYVIGNASTANGTVVPLRTMAGLAGVTQVMGVQAVDNKLVVFEDGKPTQYFREWSPATAASGSAAPTRNVGSGLANGSGFFVVP